MNRATEPDRPDPERLHLSAVLGMLAVALLVGGVVSAAPRAGRARCGGSAGSGWGAGWAGWPGDLRGTGPVGQRAVVAGCRLRCAGPGGRLAPAGLGDDAVARLPIRVPRRVAGMGRETMSSLILDGTVTSPASGRRPVAWCRLARAGRPGRRRCAATS